MSPVPRFVSGYRAALEYVVPLFVSVALCIGLGYQARLLAPAHGDNQRTFLSFEQGLSGYSLRKEWHTRLFSNMAASVFVPSYEKDGQVVVDDRTFVDAVGKWVAFWLFLANLAFILAMRRKSLWFLFGMFAAVSFDYTRGITTRIYPWDMPAFLCFAVFVVLVYKRWFRWLLLLVPLATGFKETAMLMPIAFLFWEEVTWKRRLTWFCVTLAAAVAVKVGIDVVTSNARLLYTMTAQDRNQVPLILVNLRDLLNLRLAHLIFVNAGLLVSFLLMPTLSKQALLLKIITVCFTIGILVWGVAYEYRIWLEVIPVCLLGLAEWAFPGFYVQRGSPPLDDAGT